MSRVFFALCCCLVLVLAACSLNKPITPWNFSGNCNFGFDGGSADDVCGSGRQQICKLFTDALSTPFASRAACLDTCRELRESEYQAHAIDGCQPSLSAAFTLCGQFCERNYAQ
jgi:hypothetical protein